MRRAAGISLGVVGVNFGFALGGFMGIPSGGGMLAFQAFLLGVALMVALASEG